VAFLKSLAMLALPVLLTAQVEFYPMEEVRPGLKATGRTVFSGDRIEEFDVEVLGVLENAGPKQSVILARLSGGPLERTGVLQGMSGSPVYVDGRLMGAVALGFALSKEPIAGIRPIHEMVREAGLHESAALRRPSLWDQGLARHIEPRREFLSGGSRLQEIATPVSFSGFTGRTLDQFSSQLRAIGLEPLQGISGGASETESVGDTSRVLPGSMISVLLMSGDMSVGADGTVTHVVGDDVYAFGHRFLSAGNTELPFTRSEVITLAPNLATSFKISSPKELMGSITADYSTAVRGALGRAAATVPLRVRIAGPTNGGENEYLMRIVNHRFLSPLLLQMALYSAVDATERMVGGSTAVLSGRVEFENGVAPVRLDDVYAGNANVPLQASVGVAVPLAYLMQSGFENLRLKRIDLAVKLHDQPRRWRIDSAWPVRKTVRPGETAELVVLLSGEDGEEQSHTVRYQVPEGAPNGKLHFTVADAMTTNLMEYRHIASQPMKSASQVVRLLNELRTNSGAYVRVWRPGRSYRVQGRELPAPPPSVGLILGRGQSAGSGAASYTAKLDELRITVDEAVIAGSKTTQVEVKE
jgi:hypothetical protein